MFFHRVCFNIALPAFSPAAIIRGQNKIRRFQLDIVAVHLGQPQNIARGVLRLFHTGKDRPDAVLKPPDTKGG